MNTQAVEVLDESPNFVILRTTGRRFPGIVIQGDSLKNLVNLTVEAKLALERGDTNESAEAIGELQDELLSRIQHYEEVLTRLGMQLPYQQRFLT
jgi:hypothetical protein